MKFELKEQNNTLGSILRYHLENENKGEFSSCTVVEPNSNILLVHAENISILRKALLSCKREVQKTKATFIKKFSKMNVNDGV